MIRVLYSRLQIYETCLMTAGETPLYDVPPHAHVVQ